MTISVEVIHNAQAKGYKGEPNLLSLRTWLWEVHDLFVNIEEVEVGDVIAFRYYVYYTTSGPNYKGVGTANRLSCDTALADGLSVALSNISSEELEMV